MTLNTLVEALKNKSQTLRGMGSCFWEVMITWKYIGEILKTGALFK